MKNPFTNEDWKQSTTHLEWTDEDELFIYRWDSNQIVVESKHEHLVLVYEWDGTGWPHRVSDQLDVF
jgi:hypothetical protein